MSVFTGIKTALKKKDALIPAGKAVTPPKGDMGEIDFTSLSKKESAPDIDFTSLTPVPDKSQKMSFSDELAIMDADEKYKAGLMSKDELDEEIAMIKNPVDPDIDTRGKGVQYHGTSSEIGTLDDSYYTTMNIYGQGFYTTDAVDIARGYSKKGKGKNPTMYEVRKKKDLNLYDMEKPLDPDLRKEIEEADINTEGLTTLRSVYDELREDFLPADEIQEMFSSVAYLLEKRGYDGLRHVGGSFTNKKEHNVEIIFKPKDVLDIKKLRIKSGLE